MKYHAYTAHFHFFGHAGRGSGLRDLYGVAGRDSGHGFRARKQMHLLDLFVWLFVNSFGIMSISGLLRFAVLCTNCCLSHFVSF